MRPPPFPPARLGLALLTLALLTPAQGQAAPPAQTTQTTQAPATPAIVTAQAGSSLTLAQALAGLRTSLYQTYARGVVAQQNLEITARSLALAQRTLGAQQAAQALNNATPASVQAAQAAVLDAQAAQARAAAELESARRALGSLVARDLTGVSLDSGGASTPSLPDESRALSAALAFSPEVQSAQVALQNAQDAQDAARRNRAIPSGTITAAYGSGTSSRGTLSASLNVQSGVGSLSYSQALTSLGAGTSAGTPSFTLGLNASYNLLDPGADAAINSASVAVQAAQLALQVQQQTATQGLRDAYSAARLDLGAIAAREASLSQSATALTSAQARLAAGTGTETEVLSAQVAQLQALRDLAAARFTALSSAAALSALTGF